MLVVEDDIEKTREVLVMKKYYLYNSLQKVWEKTEWERGGSWDGNKSSTSNSPYHLIC